MIKKRKSETTSIWYLSKKQTDRGLVDHPGEIWIPRQPNVTRVPVNDAKMMSIIMMMMIQMVTVTVIMLMTTKMTMMIPNWGKTRVQCFYDYKL